MARIKYVKITPEYAAAREVTAAAGDDNACFPQAVALLSGLPLEEVRAAFAEAGRKNGKATPFTVAHAAVAALGFKLEKVEWKWQWDMIATYPGVHKNLKNITTRHPVRFKKAWEGQSVMLHVNGHVAAVKDGVMHDWSINRSMHVINIYKLVKA